MREADKPQLANAIWNMGECGEGDIPKDCAFVLDGGSLLHRIPWVQGYSFGMICEEYCKFVSSNYGKPHIIFDGYNIGPSTKEDSTHTRRTKGKAGMKICFKENLPFRSKKDTFLTNADNKQNFIKLLGEYLSGKGCNVSNADGDADLLIVN